MNEFISQLLAAGTGGGIVGGVVYMLINAYLNSRDKERDQLVNDVEKLSETIRVLKDERVGKLEHKIEIHIENDKSQRILTTVEAIASRQGKIEDTMSMQAHNIATLLANDKARHEYIENIDKSFQAHKTQHHIAAYKGAQS